MTEPAIIDKVALHRIVTVLDAEHALDYNSIFSSDRELIRTLRRQLEVADIIVANKFDLISNRTADKIRGLAQSRNASARFVSAVRCELDAAVILDGIAAAGERRQPVISGMRAAAPGMRVPAGPARAASPSPQAMSGPAGARPRAEAAAPPNGGERDTRRRPRASPSSPRPTA